MGEMQDFTPVIALRGWEDGGLRLPEPALPLRNLIVFMVQFVPNMVALRRLASGSVMNPHYIGLELLPLAALRRLGLCDRLILSVHGTDIVDACRSRGARRSAYRWLLKSADAVVACSPSAAAAVRSIARVRTVVAANGSERPPEHLPRPPIDVPYIISVAAFVKIKGHETLLRAFVDVLAKQPGLRLVLIGMDGPERKNVEALAGELGIAESVVIMIDIPHEQIWAWVKHAQCLVLASTREAFGIVLLEAGLVGTPIAATWVDGISQLVGQDALLCKVGDAEGMAEAILQTLTQPDAASVRAARWQIRAAEYSWERAWAQYLALV